MYGLICRRVVALALAYVLALNSVLPLLPALASDAGSAIGGELCASDHTRSGADIPNGHEPVCPFGMTCSLAGCDVIGLPAGGGTVAVASASTPGLFFLRPDEETRLPRDGGTPFARAPPPV